MHSTNLRGDRIPILSFFVVSVNHLTESELCPPDSFNTELINMKLQGSCFIVKKKLQLQLFQSYFYFGKVFMLYDGYSFIITKKSATYNYL